MRTQTLKSGPVPISEAEYITWLVAEHNYNPARFKGRYDAVTRQLRDDFVGGSFWTSFLSSMKTLDEEYLLKHGYPLFINLIPPDIHIKPLASCLNKTYRKNVVLNKDFPNLPYDGQWSLPKDCFGLVTDLIRTSLVVKYMDGVSFLVEKLEMLSKTHGLGFKADFEARDSGYYAAHIVLSMPCQIIDDNFEYIDEMAHVEIQITTQLQEVIKKMLHKHYNETRSVRHASDYKWQWDHRSPEFASNYLGHILHYLEGMILEIRDKQK